jgi:peptidoglycan L-alanyl-D-glutamate endopeptidase CwlK
MGFTLGSRSRARLKGVHPRLVAVVERALALTTLDFFVNEGVRTPERQRELYAQGRTKPGQKVTWTLNSNHFVNPRTGFGHAVDVYAMPFSPNQTAAQSLVIRKAMMKAADELDTPIRWGGDWDRDGEYHERGEGDSPHFELWGA